MRYLFIRLCAKIKALLSRLLFLVYVPECVGCRARLAHDDIFCPECARRYMSEREQSCNICGARLDTCLCASDDLRRHGISKHIKLLYYRTCEESEMKNMAYALKRAHNKRLNDFLSAELALAIKRYIDKSGKEYIITYAPRSVKAHRRYGYDHARELALKVSELLSLEFREMFIRKRAKAQKEMSRSERERNAKISILAASRSSLDGKRIIVIDDVVTSGATMGACKDILRKRGAREVISASIYQSMRY